MLFGGDIFGLMNCAFSLCIKAPCFWPYGKVWLLSFARSILFSKTDLNCDYIFRINLPWFFCKFGMDLVNFYKVTSCNAKSSFFCLLCTGWPKNLAHFLYGL